MRRPTVLALAVLTSTGCGARPGSTPQPAAPQVAAPKAVIPAAPPYRITSDSDNGPSRREVEVKLRNKVTAEVLREIAREVRAREERPHERTLIYYYLPAAFPETAGLPWASARFKPELDVKILGLSIEEEAALKKIPLDHKGRRIGVWLQDNQYKTLDLIYEDGGTIKLAEIRSPVDRTDSEMVALEPPKGQVRRLRKAKGTNFYDLDAYGNLRVSNTEGQVISAALPMK